MDFEVVVWNLDARHRPELEVEISIVCAADAIPGEHYARRRDELEVTMLFDELDAWFVDDDELLELN